ncbi:MAG: amidohydrolase [Bacteroidetes bacterium]|nr:amidohydrolase [Bacteroidota bacterium]
MKIVVAIFVFLNPLIGYTQTQEMVKEAVNQILSPALDLYYHLHAHPELSLMEINTAKTLSSELKQVGFEVSDKVGGHGIVGVYRNGAGPVIMVRADMDALPVKEQSGLSYSSQVITQNFSGDQRPAMHACGHDMHMSVWAGTAKVLTQLKDQWTGTLLFIAQPAEEHGDGAKKMLEAGLFENFPLPDYALALHVSANLPAGKVGYTPGYSYSNVDAMEITVFGEGGHGAYPHITIDPVVLSARIVLALQTLRSREFSPQEPLVLTVGAINGGTKGNVIPDEVNLKLTLRYHNESLRTQIIESIRRICNGIAASAGLPEDKYPRLKYYESNLPGVYNDPDLTQSLSRVFEQALGQENVKLLPASMGGEDFGRFGATKHDIPICIFSLGAVEGEKYQASLKNERELPSLHSSKFAPDPQPTLKTGITAMSNAVLYLLKVK